VVLDGATVALADESAEPLDGVLEGSLGDEAMDDEMSDVDDEAVEPSDDEVLDGEEIPHEADVQKVDNSQGIFVASSYAYVLE
jgi:hypothetical protein